MYHYHHGHGHGHARTHTLDYAAYDEHLHVRTHTGPVPLQKSSWRQFEPGVDADGEPALVEEDDDEDEEGEYDFDDGVHVVPVDEYELDPLFIRAEAEVQCQNLNHAKCVKQKQDYQYQSNCRRNRPRQRIPSQSRGYLTRFCGCLRSCVSSWLLRRDKFRGHTRVDEWRPLVVQMCDRDRRIGASSLKEERPAYEYRTMPLVVPLDYMRQKVEPEFMNFPVRPLSARTKSPFRPITKDNLLQRSPADPQKIVTGKPPLPPSAAVRRRQMIEQGTLEQLRNSRRSRPGSAASQIQSASELTTSTSQPQPLPSPQKSTKAVKRSRKECPSSPGYPPQNQEVATAESCSSPTVSEPVSANRQNQDHDEAGVLDDTTEKEDLSQLKVHQIHEGSGDESTVERPEAAAALSEVPLDLVPDWGNIKFLYIPLNYHTPSRSCPKFPLFRKEFSKHDLQNKMWKVKVNQRRLEEFRSHTRELRRAHWNTRRQIGLFKRKIRKDKESINLETKTQLEPELQPRTLPTRPYTSPLVDNSLSDTTMALYLSPPPDEFHAQPTETENKDENGSVSSVRDNETATATESYVSQIPSNTSLHTKEFYGEGATGEEEVAFRPTSARRNKSAKNSKRQRKNKKLREYPAYCYADYEGDDYDIQSVTCYNSESKTEAIQRWNKKNQEMRKRLRTPTQTRRRLSSSKKYAPEERPAGCCNSRRLRRSSSPQLMRQISWNSAPAAPANSLAVLNKGPAPENEESQKSARVPKIFNPKLSPRPRRFAAHSKSEIITSKKPDTIMNDMLLTIHNVSWASAEIYCAQLKALSRSSPNVLNRHIPPLVEILLQKVAVARSKISGPAIKVLRWLYDIAPKLMEQVCDVVIGAMLDKLGGPLFIDSECIEILKIVTGHSSLGQSCLAFAKHGAGHRMSVSRCTAAKFLCELISILDIERTLGTKLPTQKRLTSSLFEAATCFLYDSNMNTKDYGRQIYCYLLDHHNFWRLYFKHVPHELKQRVNPVLDEIRDLL